MHTVFQSIPKQRILTVLLYFIVMLRNCLTLNVVYIIKSLQLMWFHCTGWTKTELLLQQLFELEATDEENGES